MLSKSQVLKSMEDLPDEFSLDDLFDKLMFIEELHRSILQSERGEVSDHEDVKKRLLENKI